MALLTSLVKQPGALTLLTLTMALTTYYGSTYLLGEAAGRAPHGPYQHVGLEVLDDLLVRVRVRLRLRLRLRVGLGVGLEVGVEVLDDRLSRCTHGQ